MSNAELGAWDGRFDDEVRIGYSLEPLPSPRLIEGQESEETEYGTPIDDDMTIEIEDIEENEESGETNVAHRVDYMLAAGCGIISGAIDSLWVGKFDFDRAREWVNWSGFCSAFIVRRLVSPGSYSTRFRPARVSCSPGWRGGVSSSTMRPIGTSPAPGRPRPGTACAARPARSCTRR